MAPSRAAFVACLSVLFLSSVPASGFTKLTADRPGTLTDGLDYEPAGQHFRKDLPSVSDILTDGSHYFPLQHKHSKLLRNGDNPWITRVGNPALGLPHIVSPAYMSAMAKGLASTPKDAVGEGNDGLFRIGAQAGFSRKLLANLTTVANPDAVKLNGTLEVNGLYWMRLFVGTPARATLPQQFVDVDIDTGSDLLWFRCDPCTHCDAPSADAPFNRAASSSLSLPMCATCQNFNKASLYTCPVRSCARECTSPSNFSCQAGYRYGDGSSFVGSMYRDVITMRKESGRNVTAPIYFACDFAEKGSLLSDPNTDGLIGLGKNIYSFPSQMFAANQTGSSDVFSTCLAGMEGGGGIVFGSDTKTPLNMSVTPMGTDATFYNATMTGILVDGTNLTGIPSSAFYNKTLQQPDTIFDTGASIAVLNQYIYNAIFKALNKSAAAQTPPLVYYESEDVGICYGLPAADLKTSVIDAKLLFPTITFSFQGLKGRPVANLTVSPDDYIVFSSSTIYPENIIACPQFSLSPDGSTNLGDPILRNHYFTFNRTAATIAFAPYNCTTFGARAATAPVNVTEVLARTTSTPAPPPNLS